MDPNRFDIQISHHLYLITSIISFHLIVLNQYLKGIHQSLRQFVYLSFLGLKVDLAKSFGMICIYRNQTDQDFKAVNLMCQIILVVNH